MAATRPDRGSATLRLLAGVRRGRPVAYDEHLAQVGPRVPIDLLSELDASGLTGRGGAAFPTGKKLRAVATRRRRPVVVVNAVEAEPLSGKDKLLLRHVPHLVLDGAVDAADAIGARTVIVVVGEHAAAERAAVEHALAERQHRRVDRGVEVVVVVAPSSFVAGEETAVTSLLNGRQALPTFKPPLPFERGVGGAPTLVNNAETLAHVALIARFGASWFREAGSADEPGTVLITIGGAVRRPGVYELPLDTNWPTVIELAGGAAASVDAFLVGGYYGTWLTREQAGHSRLSNAGLAPFGGSLGAGSIVALPASSCGVVETARVARYLAEESAGQCGPCVYGLDAVAQSLHDLARRAPVDVGVLRRRLTQIARRGACRHPDGAVKLVGSALSAFAREVELHLHGGCSGHRVNVLPVPDG